MRAIFAAFILASAAAPAQAALSGFHDSAEQINTILTSTAVADALRQAPIGHIANTGTRADGALEWQVRTQECDLTVYLRRVVPHAIGKSRYELELGDGCH